MTFRRRKLQKRNNLLLQACEDGHYDTVKALLIKHGVDLNVKNRDAQTPLHLALKPGTSHQETAAALIEAGANLGLKDKYGYTPLHTSCDVGCTASGLRLIQANADLESRDKFGNTPLHIACDKGYAELVNGLIEAGASVTACNDNDWTPLHFACDIGLCCTALIKAGAHVNATDKQGYTPLHIACRKGSHMAAAALIKAGASVDPKLDNGWTPLRLACDHGHTDAVAVLVQAGADLNAKDKAGNMVLHQTCILGYEAAASVLVHAGSGLNEKNNAGDTPLHLACASGLKRAINVLVRAGADIAAKNQNEWTPFRLLCDRGIADLVSVLIRAGADIKERDWKEWTLLHVASNNGHAAVAAELLRAGADVAAADWQGYPPLRFACDNGHEAAAAVLIEAGADVNDRDNDGDTLLHRACFNANTGMAVLLLREGADMRALDRNGRTALSYLSEQLHQIVLTEYRQNGNNAAAAHDQEQDIVTDDVTPAEQAVKIKAAAAVEAALEAIQGGKVPYNSVTCVSVGPGGTGKTATRASLQGLAFTPQRESTLGGDRLDINVRMRAGDMVSMKAVDHVQQLERALALHRRQEELPVTRGRLADVVQSNASHDQLEHLSAKVHRRLLRHAAFQSTKHTGSDAQGSSATPTSDKQKTLSQRRCMDDSFKDRTSSLSATDQLQTSATEMRADRERKRRAREESIHFRRDAEMVMRRLDQGEETGTCACLHVLSVSPRAVEEANADNGIHTRFYDMGGQPEFWPLVVSFLRNNNIISVFFRMDEVLTNIIEGTSCSSDSHFSGLEELFVWLDAVAAATHKGPVLLVGTFGDIVTSPDDRARISSHIETRLQESEHPLLRDRIALPSACDTENDLVFYAVDNTQSESDPGLCAYRKHLHALCQAAPTTTMPIPLSLIRLHDNINALARPETPSESSRACRAIRRRAGSDGVVRHMRLQDFAELYEESACTSISDNFEHKEMRLFLDFLHMQGVLTHSNSQLLDDLVVIDPLWLLKQLTVIIRRPKLHPLRQDRRLPAEARHLLYDCGILELDLVPLLWSDASSSLRVQLLSIMIKEGLAVSSSHSEARVVIPALLPHTPIPAERPVSSSSCQVHLAFYTGTALMRDSVIAAHSLQQRSSMPAGLFGQIVSMLQQSSPGASAGFSRHLSQSYAHLQLGRFSVELELAARVVKVTLHVAHAMSMLQQVKHAVEKVLRCWYSSLQYEVLTAVNEAQDLFVRVITVQEHVQKQLALHLHTDKQLSVEEMQAQFESLLPYKPQSGMYHNFVSYRHGDYDSRHTSAYVNHMSQQLLGSQGTAVTVFYDQDSLEDGKQFDESFMAGIARSLTFTPFVTTYALKRLKDPNSLLNVDNMLLEWWLAYELYRQAPGCFPVCSILPIFCGSVSETAFGIPEIAKVFKECPLDHFPDAVNEPTYSRLALFLREELNIHTELPRLTVRELVAHMYKFLSGMLAWDILQSELDVPLSRDSIMMAVHGQNVLRRVFERCVDKVLPRIEKDYAAQQQTMKVRRVISLGDSNKESQRIENDGDTSEGEC